MNKKRQKDKSDKMTKFRFTFFYPGYFVYLPRLSEFRLILHAARSHVKFLTWQNPGPLGFAASLVEELFVAQDIKKGYRL